VSRSEGVALLPLAESIVDGSVVDWEAAEARATTDEQAIIRQLRVLSNLAGLHRSLPRDGGGRRNALQSSSPAIGTWAHLTLLARLGGGAFGEVYRAWDRHLEREVALKLLKNDESDDDLDASRIAAEGRRLARVRHPNVITVHGVDVHDRRVGLWMELVRGATLEQGLQEHGPLSAREAALVGIDLCRALAAIHAAGLIHRDVKAQNVMREDGGRIVLMDLGTGRETDQRGRAFHDLAGTPLYLAPEIFDGASASERTDLYSLGVLLYHLVTGLFPIRATSLDELKRGHKNGTAVRLRDARADLPTAFVAVIDKAIASDPSDRYVTTGAFEAALVDALNGATARPATAGATAASRLRRWALLGFVGLSIAGAAVAYTVWLTAHRGKVLNVAPGAITSIAVLPLANLSGDPSQEYFADGVTEMLIDDLARIKALRVISRTSVEQYRRTKTPLADVARSLNVDAVLEGSVLRIGDRVRISADLVHVASDRHVWVQQYERDVRDVLALQNEVAATIAREVQVQLTPDEQAGFAIAVGSTQVNLAAQEAYLQGRYYWNKRTPEGLARALEYFRKSAEASPTFARAYAGQADAYNLLPDGMAPAVAYPLAKAAAARALALDPTLAEAHTSMAFATFIFDRDWTTTDAAFRRALQFNPGYATAHHWYGEYLSAMGRLDEAFAQFDEARALDPRSSGVLTSIGSTLYIGRRLDEAITQLRASLEVDPGNTTTYLYLALSYEQKGMLENATEEVRRGLRLNPLSTSLRAERGRLEAMSGRRAEALATARALVSPGTPKWRSLHDAATVYIALGDYDRAFDLLNRAVREHTPGLLWAKLDPAFDPLRKDPRFARLLTDLRLLP